ncbi:hypothetical protein FJ471_00315 [Mesorhizobium sp. B2-7-1]|nr:hypothetical protein FJ471_00315 [Mesorhizobium sp. B2-7-1]
MTTFRCPVTFSNGQITRVDIGDPRQLRGFASMYWCIEFRPPNAWWMTVVWPDPRAAVNRGWIEGELVSGKAEVQYFADCIGNVFTGR